MLPESVIHQQPDRGGVPRVETHVLFPTPLWLIENPAAATLNPRLSAHVLSAMQADPGKATDNRSNRRGWRGPDLNLERTEPWIPLAGFVRQALQSILAPDVDYALMSPGVNVHLDGGFNVTHVHSNCLVSGVYYIACPPGGGAIVFEDPRVQAVFADYYPLFCQNQGAPKVEMTPHEGLLVLFPSWLAHWVEPSAATEPRISLPINVVRRSGHSPARSQNRPLRRS